MKKDDRLAADVVFRAMQWYQAMSSGTATNAEQLATGYFLLKACEALWEHRL